MATHRVNIVVTEEQHSLLMKLAAIDPDTRSAASFVRDLLDEATPLLRATVPMMVAAHEQLTASRTELREPIRNFMSEIKQRGLFDPAGAHAPSVSEGVRSARRSPRGRK